jgi:Leucine-rich repeat (LRR) protein
VYFNDNRLTGRIPSNICNANIMRQLYVFDNSLTGHLPSLDMCDNLQIFLLQNNRLSGRPDDTFGREGILGKLEAIDLSSNHFSGTVPSSLYRLPNLTYTSIVGNCFTGKLSDAICEAVRLDTLLLEGLRSGDRCRHSVWNPFSHMSLYYSEPIQGSIPDCVWEMSALTTLHISGNGLTGSIPAHNNLPRLADLSLGGNQLTGTIPDVILASVPYITCDLSSNRLKGGLSREYANNASGDENKKFTVDKNRLSGPIPDFIRRVTSLSVLAGNYFSCHHRDSLPPHDKYTESYVCGSDDLDVSLLLWLAIFCLVILLGVLAYSLRNVKGSLFFFCSQFQFHAISNT